MTREAMEQELARLRAEVERLRQYRRWYIVGDLRARRAIRQRGMG